MKVIIYDAGEGAGLVQLSWILGAPLLSWRGNFDAIIAAKSWGQVRDELTSLKKPIKEIQYWGHGSPGSITLNQERFREVPPELQGDFKLRLASGALLWFRTCSTFAGKQGHAFASHWSKVLGCRVAGSTFKIGFPYHSGQRSVRPGERPYWSTLEGFSDVGGTAWSHRKAPNTLPFYATSLPREW